MMITIDIQKLIDNNKEFIINWSSKFNSKGQIVLDSSKGENKLKWYVENYLLKMTTEDLEKLFDERGSLVDESPALMFEEWNRITILRRMISNSLENIFEDEYSYDDVVGKKPGKKLYKNLATKFIPHIHANAECAFIQYDTDKRSWKIR